jgi:hypothetical protein
MAESEEKALARRSLQVAKNVEDVLWVKAKALRQALGTRSERQLLLDPVALFLVELRELLFECRAAIHDFLDNVERRFLRLALEQAGGTKKSAARLRVATLSRGALLVRGWRSRQAR